MNELPDNTVQDETHESSVRRRCYPSNTRTKLDANGSKCQPEPDCRDDSEHAAKKHLRDSGVRSDPMRRRIESKKPTEETKCERTPSGPR